MPKITWDESFSVNNEEIDNQHQKGIEIINELHDALINEKEFGNIIEESLEAMVKYAQFHFSFEEEYMKKILFPDLINHVDVHSNFMSKLVKCQNEVQKGKIILYMDIMQELMNWLLGHILEEDQKYASFLRDSKD